MCTTWQSFHFLARVLAACALALSLFGATAGAVTIDAVYFAQTHVQQPNHPYFYLVGNKDTLIKAHVVDPAKPAAPSVTALLTLGGQTTNLTLTGPVTLPGSISNGFGVVQHAFSNSFTAVIPKAWVKSGLTVAVQAGAAQTNFSSLKIGAPTQVIMTMLDVHYFAQATGNYPTGWEAELEAKWPVADLELRRLRNVVFPELVIPPRPDVGAPAARVKSKEDYTAQTGLSFDGEQAAALAWNGALKKAAGTAGRISLYFMSIYGAYAGGQAGGFAGVGSGTSIGILHHELGHALSLPHWGDNAAYPYKGDLYGIAAPAIYNDTHAGPVWAYDPVGRKFIPCTVQSNNAEGHPAGTYKGDPMQGGGTGFQESGYLMNHFSDYSVNEMRDYLEGHVVVWNSSLGRYASWNNTAKDYTSTVSTNGVNYPIERDVSVISILASVSGANPGVNMVYPPIGPYVGGLIRRFDPSSAADRTAAASLFAPADGCDVCARVVQGGVTNTYMLAASFDTSADPYASSSLQTAAVNLRASDGAVTRIDLLLTPDAEVNGLPASPPILYTWPVRKYYWDNNGGTAGFGTAAGTWAAPTAGNASQGWSTNTTGGIVPASVSTTTGDELNFGGSAGLAAGTIAVSGNVAARSLTFAPGSGAITLTGGTISVTSLSAQNTGNAIASPIALSGFGTVAFSRNTSAAGTLTLGGTISGALGLTFTTPDVSSGNYVQTIVLGATNSYAGTTLITTGNAGNTLTVKAGVTNALPVTTVLRLDGNDGSGSGRTVSFDLNGKNQTLAGLANVTGRTLRNQRIVNSSGTATLTLNNSASYTFSGNINGSGLSLTKKGSGMLTLSATNSYTGDTTINAGTLRLGDDSVLPGGTGVILTGGALSLNGTTNTVQSITISGGSISGQGRLILVNGGSTGVYCSAGSRIVGCNLELGSGSNGVGDNLDFGAAAGATLTVTGAISSAAGYGVDIGAAGGGTVAFGAANTYAGQTKVQAGTLRLGIANGIKSGNDLVVNSGQTFDMDGYAQALDSMTGSGTVDTGGGALTVGVGGSSFTFGGSLIGTGGLTKSGGGVLTLTGGSAFSGNVGFETAADLTNTPSVIAITHSQALGVGPKTVTLAMYGRTLKLDGSSGNLTIASNITFDTSNDGSAGGGNVASAALINVAGTNTINGAFSLTLGGGGTLFQSDAGSLVLAGGISAATSGRTLAFTGGGHISVSGVIANGSTAALPVTKTGGGTLTLAGTNTYTGPTTVSSGTLLVHGRLSTGRVAVAAAGTLGGTGTLGGAVTNAGVVAPGASTGRLTLDQSYRQQAGGALNIELGGTAAGTTYDVLQVGGAAVLGGALNVTLVNGFVPSVGNQFILLQAASLGGTAFATTNLPPLGSNRWVLSTVANTAVVLSVAGPPPTGYALWASAITNGLTNDNDCATGDGYPNLLKYATGSSPTNSDGWARLYLAMTNGHYGVRFSRNTNATDVTVIVEGRHSLTNGTAWAGIATNRFGSWGAAANWSENASTHAAGTVVWDPAPPATSGFFRLRVSRP